MLKSYFSDDVEAGIDEAGRGCLAGPVFAAAVILPRDFSNAQLNDSKKLTAAQRDKLRLVIEKEALAWAVASCTHSEIDKINILQATYKAMHNAISKLEIFPERLLIDGNRFKNYKAVPHHCIVKGDGLFASIAAASVLAKTHRDEYMLQLHHKHPVYCWDRNKAYATAIHVEAIKKFGLSPYHRKSFQLKSLQPQLIFPEN
ncbi:MAG: ribonuclease HII [Bacteroidetes bacterium]|nr:ribonuclease HII [Bacteroidota bacterium]MBX7239474.1 ribonuclease HII [Bacteroidia bacterium]MCC7514256.1 ribonuclease HII [Bacteroidia bacterium]HCI57329.1 ribonuclease HII [Bacteroidota bacterium]HMU77728.1 ribonuclease HII [Bacteroidia bacterium]